MALNDIILRSVSNPPLVTKGSALTFTELDDNFIEVYNYLLSLNNGGDIPLFDMATTYSLNDIVKYGGKIYNYISGTPASGLNPVSYPANWAETTLGAVAHLHNTDTKLAEGTADEVTAAELASLVNEQVISKTTAQFNTLVSTSALIPNRLYVITDVYAVSPADIKIYVRAISGNQISGIGQISCKIPNENNIVGVWTPLGYTTYAVNDCVSFSGAVWINLTGSNSPTDPPTIDATNWALVSYATPNKYINVLFDAEINYYANVLSVNYFYDSRNNMSYNGYNLQGLYPLICDRVASHYNNKLVGYSTFASENLCNIVQCYNNTFVRSQGFDFPYGSFVSIINSNFYNSRISSGNVAEVIFSYCNFRNVNLYFVQPAGGMNFDNCTFDCDTYTQFNIRDNAGGGTSKKMTPDGSTFTDTIDITGLTKINLATNGVADIYGIFIITTGNFSETINKIEGYNFNAVTAPFPIIIQPVQGRQLDVTTTALGVITIDDIVGNNANPITLVGDNFDYIKVIKKDFNGVEAWQIIEIVNN